MKREKKVATFLVGMVDSNLLGRRKGHRTRRCRRITYPESYITKYTTYTKKEGFSQMRV